MAEYNKFLVLDVSTSMEKQTIRILNNEFDKAKKRSRTYFKHNISLEGHIERTNKEPITEVVSVEDLVINRLQNDEILKAINKLTKIQRETIIKHFYQEKSLRQIARERGVNEKTVNESYHSAIKRLGGLLKDLFSD